MQIAIIVLLAVVIALLIAVVIGVTNNRVLTTSLAQTIALIYERCESLILSSSEIVGRIQGNHSEVKEQLARILEMEVSNSQLLTKILENVQQSGTTILDEDGKVINTLTFSQRKSERKLKVVQSKQSKVDVDEKN
jgi:predicted PurR-regulated permease PerM